MSRTTDRLLTLWAIAALLVCGSSQVFAQNLVASVDRFQIQANESINLNVLFDRRVSDNALDVSVLDQDWQVIKLGSGGGTQMINGRVTEQTSWNFLLVPKRPGQLLVPSFRIGDAISDARQIEVAAVTSTELNDASPMQVTVEPEKFQARIGEQLLFTVRLEALPDVSNLSIEDPSAEGADIYEVDRLQSVEQRDGVNVSVIEWVYALIPNTTGSVSINSRLFSAYQSRTRRVLVQSGVTSIDVLPEATDANHTVWFNANDVELSSVWEGNRDEIRVGEPITRSVSIRAEGQRSVAIPELDMLEGNFRTYPDQPELGDQIGQNGLVGTRRETMAIVASEEGSLELPEIRLAWWNNTTEQWNEAILPAEILNILPPLINNTATTPNTEFSVSGGLSPSSDEQPPVDYPILRHPAWFWTTIGLMAVLCILFFRQRSLSLVENQTKETLTQSNEHSSTSVFKTLVAAVQSRQPTVVRTETVRWARKFYRDQTISSLQEVANRSENTALQTQLVNLDAQLYGSVDVQIDWLELEQGFRSVEKHEENSTTANEPLPPLYPSTG